RLCRPRASPGTAARRTTAPPATGRRRPARRRSCPVSRQFSAGQDRRPSQLVLVLSGRTHGPLIPVHNPTLSMVRRLALVWPGPAAALLTEPIPASRLRFSIISEEPASKSNCLVTAL